MLDLFAGVLRLEIAVESRDHMPINVIAPEPTVGAGFGIRWEQRGTGVEVFEVFHQHGALVARPFSVAECRDETARVEGEKPLGFVIRVYFYVLVVQAFEFERDPNALDKGTVGRRGVNEATPGQNRKEVMYQKQLPKSFKSCSLERLLTVAEAAPVALVW